jgi:hypothetical protein
LSLLFSAQQNQLPQTHPSPSPFTLRRPVASVPASSQPSPQQSNLHSFWAIPSSTRQSSPASNCSSFSNNSPLMTSADHQFFEATNCEDCEVSLNPDNADAMDVDVMMDTDTYNGGLSHACSSCGKQVCHSCAVSNLGSERKCLMCAGKKWVGGIGWMNMG